MDNLFKEQKDSRVADVTCDPGFDTRPLITHFGPDVTWRQVFLADRQELTSIPGYGSKTVERILAFISENFNFTFSEFLNT